MKLDLSIFLKNTDETVASHICFDRKTFLYNGCEYPVSSAKPFELCVFNQGGEKLFLSGESDISFICPCDRCLSDVEVNVPVVISEEFDIRDDVIFPSDDSSLTVIEDNFIDIDYLLANQILENWPVKILCKDDCKGICPVCGINRNLSECGCEIKSIDPRMQQFQDVFKDFKEV